MKTEGEKGGEKRGEKVRVRGEGEWGASEKERETYTERESGRER